MRATLTVVAAGGAVREDVCIEAPGSTPVGELLTKLRELVAEPADRRATIGGVAVEPTTLTPFASSGLRDGAVVSFAALLHHTSPVSYFELRVVGGPTAGTVHRLGVGRTAGWRIVAVAPRTSMVSEHADHVFDATGVGLERILDDANVAILVDDAERLAESPVTAMLERVTRTARDTRHRIAVAGLTDELSLGFRGFIVDARRARAGLLLSPRSALDGDVLGIRLPRSTGAPAPPGRGLLVMGNAVIRLQVARPTVAVSPTR